LSTILKTKIIRIGNSKGIVIPSLVIKELALEEGDQVYLSYNYRTQVLSCTFPKTKQLKLKII